jgi:hypothetical protein
MRFEHLEPGERRSVCRAQLSVAVNLRLVFASSVGEGAHGGIISPEVTVTVSSANRGRLNICRKRSPFTETMDVRTNSELRRSLQPSRGI